MVINPDTNELEYTIGWSAIGSENGCAGYQIYVQPEGETAAALGELVPVRGGTCSVSRSLEDYAGKTIDLYLVAVAADDSGYADSPNGIVYTMTVPMRLDTPSVKWSYNWNATANNPIPAADFRSGGHRYAGECGQCTARRQHLSAADKNHRDGRHNGDLPRFRNERKRRQLRL